MHITLSPLLKQAHIQILPHLRKTAACTENNLPRSVRNKPHRRYTFLLDKEGCFNLLKKLLQKMILLQIKTCDPKSLSYNYQISFGECGNVFFFPHSNLFTRQLFHRFMTPAFYLQWQHQHQDKNKFRLSILCELLRIFNFLHIMIFDTFENLF